MAVVFGLLAAAAYGTSDFAAGLASRRYAAGPVTGVAQVLGLVTAAAAVILFPGVGPRATALEWGAVSGLGRTLGTLSLLPRPVDRSDERHRYPLRSTHRCHPGHRRFGSRQSSDHPCRDRHHPRHPGDRTGVLAAATPAAGLRSRGPALRDAGGLGFALLFIALDRAGTHAGAWPLVPGPLVSLVLVAPFAYRGVIGAGRPSRAAVELALGAGVLSGVANLLFLAASGHGQLAIISVLTALYPAVTVLLARIVLAERWTRLQAAGLLIAGAAIILVTVS